MIENILAVDAGEATGWSRWLLDNGYPIQRVEWGIVPGGFDAFIPWLEQHLVGVTLIIFERFNPKLGTGGGVKNYEALEIQGAVRAVARALGIEIVMHDVGMKALCTDAALKRNGLWIENSEVDWEDARDVNDSQIHVLAYAKSMNHEPSIEAFWPEVD